MCAICIILCINRDLGLSILLYDKSCVIVETCEKLAINHDNMEEKRANIPKPSISLRKMEIKAKAVFFSNIFAFLQFL